MSKNVVVIGGGHGSSVVLTSLLETDLEICSVVSMADNGGSTGRLRNEFGVLPPGDVRQCIVALSPYPELRELFNYRFSSGELKGHSFGNLFLVAGDLLVGDMQQSIELAKQAMGVKAKILPVTNELVDLVLVKESGEKLIGEYTIGNTMLESKKPQLELSKPVQLNPNAAEEIINADLVVIAPGNFYCSIIPSLIVTGMAETLAKSTAKLMMICNLANMPLHTSNYDVRDYIDEVERFIGKDLLDVVVYNTADIKPEMLKEGEQPVALGGDNLSEYNFETIGIEAVGTTTVQANPNDEIASIRSQVSHDKQKLREIILEQLKND